MSRAGYGLDPTTVRNIIDMEVGPSRAGFVPTPLSDFACTDCGLATFDAGEDYMVHNELWAAAWTGRLKPVRRRGLFLCIGCFESRIGRTLNKHDFTDVPVNDPEYPGNYMSDRLRDRLSATETRLVLRGM